MNLESPAEKARENIKAEEQAFGENGKRPLRIEEASTIYNETVKELIDNKKRRYINHNRQSLVDSIDTHNFINTRLLFDILRNILRRIDKNKEGEKQALFAEVKLANLDLASGLTLFSKILKAYRKSDLEFFRLKNIKLSQKEIEDIRERAKTVTRQKILRKPRYRNGFLADERLSDFIEMTPEEIEEDKNYQQINFPFES